MAINFCTLDSSSVAAFCGARRAIVLQNLLDQKYPPAPASSAGAARSTRFEPTSYLPPPEDRPSPFTFTTADLQITVQMDGKTHSSAIQPGGELDFVTVSNLQVERQAPSAVNISELRIDDADR